MSNPISVLAVLIFAFLADATLAMACRPNMPYVEARTKNRMYAELLTEHQVSVDKVTSMKLSDYDLKFAWVKSDSGYMCHDKETTSAVFAVEYDQVKVQYIPNENGGHTRVEHKSKCTFTAKVTAVFEYFEGGKAPAFEIELVNPKACTE